MKIHNSHSRKELFDIISVFELPITNRNEYNKAQIQMKIIDCLEYFDKINPDMEYFFIENKEDLIKYQRVKESLDIVGMDISYYPIPICLLMKSIQTPFISQNTAESPVSEKQLKCLIRILNWHIQLKLKSPRGLRIN